MSNVYLNVYDLIIDDVCLSSMNTVTIPLGFGAFHTGVEVYDTEVSFSINEGIHNTIPQTAIGVVFRKKIYMGYTELSFDEIKETLETLSKEYQADNYDIFKRNCNHFSEAFCFVLVNRSIPRWINKLAKFSKHLVKNKNLASFSSESQSKSLSSSSFNEIEINKVTKEVPDMDEKENQDLVDFLNDPTAEDPIESSINLKWRNNFQTQNNFTKAKLSGSIDDTTEEEFSKNDSGIVVKFKKRDSDKISKSEEEIPKNFFGLDNFFKKNRGNKITIRSSSSFSQEDSVSIKETSSQEENSSSYVDTEEENRKLILPRILAPSNSDDTSSPSKIFMYIGSKKKKKVSPTNISGKKSKSFSSEIESSKIKCHSEEKRKKVQRGIEIVQEKKLMSTSPESELFTIKRSSAPAVVPSFQLNSFTRRRQILTIVNSIDLQNRSCMNYLYQRMTVWVPNSKCAHYKYNHHIQNLTIEGLEILQDLNDYSSISPANKSALISLCSSKIFSEYLKKLKPGIEEKIRKEIDTLKLETKSNNVTNFLNNKKKSLIRFSDLFAQSDSNTKKLTESALYNFETGSKKYSGRSYNQIDRIEVLARADWVLELALRLSVIKRFKEEPLDKLLDRESFLCNFESYLVTRNMEENLSFLKEVKCFKKMEMELKNIAHSICYRFFNSESYEQIFVRPNLMQNAEKLSNSYQWESKLYSSVEEKIFTDLNNEMKNYYLSPEFNSYINHIIYDCSLEDLHLLPKSDSPKYKLGSHKFQKQKNIKTRHRRKNKRLDRSSFLMKSFQEADINKNGSVDVEKLTDVLIRVNSKKEMLLPQKQVVLQYTEHKISCLGLETKEISFGLFVDICKELDSINSVEDLLKLQKNILDSLIGSEDSKPSVESELEI